MKEAPLFERLGGSPALEAVVDAFYARLLSDDSISHFFDGYDMGQLKAHQVCWRTVHKWLTFPEGLR